jgi:hypothetical protein
MSAAGRLGATAQAVHFKLFAAPFSRLPSDSQKRPKVSAQDQAGPPVIQGRETSFDPIAHRILMDVTGEGVPQDDKQALKWYLLLLPSKPRSSLGSATVTWWA